MNLKSKKGYSLVEIGVGVLILMVFLICSVALFNGCYNTYRMIQQRNLAMDLAITHMENILQMDKDVLTGFFVEELDTNTNKYVLVPNSEFEDYVIDTFDDEFIVRYERLYSGDIDEISDLTNDEIEEYIFADRNFLIKAFIGNVVRNYTDEELNSDSVKNGDYALLTSSVKETGNQALLYPGVGVASEIPGEMGVRTTITRLPLTDDYAYGNEVLKLKVQVFYTNKVNISGITQNDVYDITLESLKIAK